MPLRAGDTYLIPGKGVVNARKKTYTGKGKGPAGTKKVKAPALSEIPSTTVSSSGEITVSGYDKPRAARRAKSATRASQRRARRAALAVAPKPQAGPRRSARSRPRAPEKYVAPKLSADGTRTLPVKGAPASKPVKFAGKPTAGAPTLKELRTAKRAKALRVNRQGFVTTPRVRKVTRTIKRTQKKARRSRADLPHLEGEGERNAKTVLRRGERKKATRKEKLAAIETGLVESGFKNYTDQDETDADSLGWRQERAEIYGTGPTGPTNVKASADRFYEEARTDAGTSTAPTPGLLAQATQGSAFPERYDERAPEAKAILSAYNKGKLKPAQREKLAKAKKEARKLGLSAGKTKPRGTTKLPGPYDGSRAMVRKILGAKVHGDKEEGHSSTGDHDPSQPNAYAQDISAVGGNPAEGEPGFTQKTLDRMVKNLRKMGADVPDLTLGADNWEGTVNGYQVQILTIPHGSGPHIHTGARWTGESTATGGVVEGGGVSFGTSDVAAYAQATGQSVSSVRAKLRKGKLTGLQLLKRLEQLGVAPGISPVSEVPEERQGSPTLSALERKYLGAAA